MITTIIFDLGGVLFTNGSRAFREYVSKKFHIPEDNVQKVVSGTIGTAYREGKLSRDEFWKQFQAILGISQPVVELEEAWIHGYELIEDTKELLFQLKKRYATYYLSDNVKERVDRLEQQYHFLSWFDGGIFSHEVGIRKPNPDIYTLILAKTKSKPQETIYIDDKPRFLIPAKELGIHTILFENPKQLQEDIRALTPLQ